MTEKVTEQFDFEGIIANIFQIKPENPERLKSRESSTVEFKLSFHSKGSKWEDYGKTIAAFANTKGGCLVFGIKDKPHDLIGMANDNFEDFDPETLTRFLNSRFSPEINWYKHLHTINGKQYGLIYVRESIYKPVIAITNGADKICEADIYYRYRGRSEKIKYPELRNILEENRRKEQELWMSHLQRIASIGVHDAAIFNPDDGIVRGKSGAFIIDKKLLPKLSFIREGEFQEVKGAPAIRIVGDAHFVGVGNVKESESIERKAIRLDQILEFFLLQKTPSEPKYFIEAACHEMTGNLPIYYFSQMEKMNLNQLKEIILNEISHQQGKKNLLERLDKKDKNIFQSIPNTDSDSSIKKSELKAKILLRDSSEITEVDSVRFFQVIRSLGKDEIDIDYIFPKVYQMYKKYWGKGGNLRSEIYKAICNLDKEIFCPTNFYSCNDSQSASE